MSTAIIRRPPTYTIGGGLLDDILKKIASSGKAAVGAVDSYAASLQPGSLGKIALGADANTQMGLVRGTGKTLGAIPGVSKAGAMRFAMSAPVKGALRIVPGLSFLGAGLDVADVLTNDTSIGNKAMDATAMAIGGTLGAALGPVGIASGMTLAKMGSDGLQYIFGDKKTPEQRKLEEALRALNGGLI